MNWDEHGILVPRCSLAARFFEVGLIPQQPDAIGTKEIGGELCWFFFQQPGADCGLFSPDVFPKIPLLAITAHTVLEAGAAALALRVGVVFGDQISDHCQFLN
ncbi:hypothetical protein [Synechococcus sp. MEDNS5]|uniref:hypothetical protein n=1 Tax=Synechococcus sp. MEDNS5 TaxID=1442554 RepID=UPI001645FDE4|nr:hypothetical protein [Synechococcus sp. MEDNS5]